MVVDYHAPKKQTIENCYPFPHMDELIDQLVDASVFSSLHLVQGYHHVRI